MDLKTKVYQMFILSPQGVDFDSEVQLCNALKNGLGGVIYFTKNIQSIEQTKTLSDKIANIAKIKPFISIDQEGGRVERTENIYSGKKFLSARYVAKKGVDFVKKQTQQISELLLELGVNMNFSPVLDVDTNPNNPIIGERAYSSNCDDVAEFGLLVMNTYIENEIIPVCKHFPGHGDTEADSHIDLPVINLSYEEYFDKHIFPFVSAIKNNAPAIMVGHIYCSCFDNEVKPASLSENVIKKFLLKQLNFNGLVVSDDMQMGGLKNYTSVEAVILGLKAGVNLFLYRDSTQSTIEIIENVYKQVKEDVELQKLVDISYEKIISLKRKFKII